MKPVPKRCFIEVDLDIDLGFCGQFESFQNKIGIPFHQFFPLVVTDAARLKPDVWKAIKASDEIWIDTSFIGESGKLLIEMMQMALNAGLNNKRVINLNKWQDVAWSFPEEAKELVMKLSDLNIKFIYSDDKDFKKYL